MRSVDSDEGRAGNPQHRLEIGRYELHVVVVKLFLVADSKRRTPPCNVVISGNADRLAHPLRIAEKDGRTLELSRTRALR